MATQNYKLVKGAVNGSSQTIVVFQYEQVPSVGSFTMDAEEVDLEFGASDHMFVLGTWNAQTSEMDIKRRLPEQGW